MNVIYKLSVNKAYAHDIRDAMPSFQRLNPQTFAHGDLPVNLTGKGVRVAILDTGVVEHPCLKAVTAGVNLGRSRHSRDNEGHAHVVAGLIAASDTDNIVGMAPEAVLVYAKIADDAGNAVSDAIGAGLLWAAVIGVQVVVLSHAVNFNDPTISTQLTKLEERDIVLVADTPLEGSSRPGSVIFSDEYKLKDNESEVLSLYTEARFVSLSTEDAHHPLIAGLITLLLEKPTPENFTRISFVRSQLASLAPSI